jgi:hypothetical protein
LQTKPERDGDWAIRYAFTGAFGIGVGFGLENTTLQSLGVPPRLSSELSRLQTAFPKGY